MKPHILGAFQEPPALEEAPQFIRMNALQIKAVFETVEFILAEVRDYRSRHHDGAPDEDEIEHFFDRPDLFLVTADPSVDRAMRKLEGLALGLGFTTRLALYREYSSGTFRRRPTEMTTLLQAAAQALSYLCKEGDQGADSVTVTLGLALAPFESKPLH